jgi:hypothetical protein
MNPECIFYEIMLASVLVALTVPTPAVTEEVASSI